MKTYRVGVCYEEGFVMKVKATSKENAEEKAKAICNEYSGVYESMVDAKGIIGKIDTVHREVLTLDAEEKTDVLLFSL
jgi:hypothetical protein